MKIVLAFDSFKGSLSASELNQIAQDAILSELPEAEIQSILLADGGEGTVDSLVGGLNGEIIQHEITNLNGDLISAKFGLAGNNCIIECASSVGLSMSDMNNIELKTSYGMGQQIKYALDLGYRNFILGLGGSGTNDGGIGLLSALGYRFRDKLGNLLDANLFNMQYITTIDFDEVDKRLSQAQFTVLSDVSNSLCGKNGATFVYGIQKGINQNQCALFDSYLANFSSVCVKEFGFDYSTHNGAGAAGGIGYSCLQFLSAKITSGIDYILGAVNARQIIGESDLIFTGEGKTDIQTLNGKLIAGVAKLAKQFDKPVLVISGALSSDAYRLHENSIVYLSSIQDYPANLVDVIRPEITRILFYNRVKESIKLLRVGQALQD